VNLEREQGADLLDGTRIVYPALQPSANNQASTATTGGFMKQVILAATAIALMTVPAAAQSKAKSIAETTGVASVLGMAPSTEDFVKTAAMSDMLEIESSKLAQQKADARSKTFAGKMIGDHTQTSGELKSLVQGGKVKAELPKALDSSHQSKLDNLKGLNGVEFDKAYDDLQRSVHKDAVSLFERYAKGGDNKALKSFAAKHLPHLKQHLKAAEQLQN
jgi:putative membrane protein